jgi:hypothetical protein
VHPLDAVLTPEIPPGGKLDIVQIDVEGAEWEVLRGMENLLTRDRPTLLIELHGPLLPRFGTTKADFLRWLGDRDYDIRWVGGEAINDPGYTHILCVSRSDRP